MADDNTIGLKAELDLSDWTPSQQQLEAAITHINSIIDGSAKKAEENAKRVADAEKKSADEREKANKKAADAAEAAVKKQEAALNKAVTNFKKFQIAAAIAIGAAVVAYKELDKAATELGNTDAIAQFKAMDDAIGGFKDTLLEAGLDMLKVVDAVNIVTDSLAWMQDIVAKSAAGWAGMLTLIQGVINAGGQIAGLMQGKGPVVIDTKAIVANAQAVTARVYKDLSTTPGRREATTQADKDAEDHKKAQEKKAKDLEDYISKAHDLTIKSGESILEAEKDFSDKSVEAWSSYMEKVADITAKGIAKRAELARDYSDKIAAAETDYQRGIEDAQYSHGKKMVDIERDYQKAIRDAQENYQQDALDAIRNLDAIGLIRAKEKRDKELANARTSRDEANAAEGENYTRQLYELQRSLEDKRREAEAAYQRGLDDQRATEQEALQDAKNAYNKQVSDTAQAFSDKQAAINAAYKNELTAAQVQYGILEGALDTHMQAMQAIMNKYNIGATSAVGIGGTARGGTRRRASGGLDIVNVPTQFVAGEAGPEMVYTAPLGRSIPAPIMQTVNHVGDFSHSIDAAISSSVAGLDGRITAVVRKAISEVLR